MFKPTQILTKANSQRHDGDSEHHHQNSFSNCDQKIIVAEDDLIDPVTYEKYSENYLPLSLPCKHHIAQNSLICLIHAHNFKCPLCRFPFFKGEGDGRQQQNDQVFPLRIDILQEIWKQKGISNECVSLATRFISQKLPSSHLFFFGTKQ
jgi:hypothetical protein